MLDQTKLPSEEVILQIENTDSLVQAIQQLSIRGAPALGVAGAYGVLLAITDWQPSEDPPDWAFLSNNVQALRNARPTAVNLNWAITRLITTVKSQNPQSKRAAYQLLEQEAIALHKEDEARCRKIGEYGAALLGDCPKVITHCNTGALATGGIGTALGVIYTAAMHGKQVEVYADETRPLLQGARLTAWELQRAGIPVYVMTDGMAASLMHQTPVDAVIVGADRIANNGDTANKIGTYQLALAARAHNVPFYVAAPVSTVDTSLGTGDEIPIEMRSGSEITSWQNIQTAPPDVAVYSPAFDVTPAQYITGIITDLGIAREPYNFQDFIGENL